ncbi:hypothetical protein, partial [[Eubacterium] cellulosolvens]
MTPCSKSGRTGCKLTKGAAQGTRRLGNGSEKGGEFRSIYGGAGAALGGLPTFLGLPRGRPRLPGGRPRLPRGR